MSVDNRVARLVGFVELCRTFGVEVSPAESSEFVRDFGAIPVEDRALMEEAAVGALARDGEAETTVRRLFPLYFSGGSIGKQESPLAASEEESEERESANGHREALDPTQQQRMPRPNGQRSPSPQRNAPPAKPTPQGMKPLLQGLEAASMGDLADAAMDAAEAALESLLGPQEANRLLGDPSARQQRRQKLEQLLKDMARPAKPTQESAQSEQEQAEEESEQDSEDSGDGEDGQGDEGQGSGEDGQGAQGQNGQGQGAQGQGMGQGMQGQGGQGQGQGQDGQGSGTGRGGQGQGMQGYGQESGRKNGVGEEGFSLNGSGGQGKGRGMGPHGTPQADLDRLAQQLGRLAAEWAANGALDPDTAARWAAALTPGLARAFLALMTAALKANPSPQREERLQEAVEAIAGRLLAEGDLSPKDLVRSLSAADERLKIQNTISGSGLRSLLHDTEALSDLLHRYRRNRDLLPLLTAKLSDALRKMLTRPSPVMERSDSGRLDLRATMRGSIAYGGVPLEFHFRQKRLEGEIVLALDTSGSQRSWAASAVLAAHALDRLLPRLRAYTFASELVEVTRYLNRPERFVERLEDFGGFSNYEMALAQLEREGRLTRRTTLLIVGDARDAQGTWKKEREGRYSRYLDPESARIMARLVRRCRRVLVLNPESENRWDSGDSAALHYADVGAEVLHVESPLHLAEQLALLSRRI